MFCLFVCLGLRKRWPSSSWEGENSGGGTQRWSSEWEGNSLGLKIVGYFNYTASITGRKCLSLTLTLRKTWNHRCCLTRTNDLIHALVSVSLKFPSSGCFTLTTLRRSCQRRRKSIWLTCCQSPGWRSSRPPALCLRNGFHRCVFSLRAIDVQSAAHTPLTAVQKLQCMRRGLFCSALIGFCWLFLPNVRWQTR